MDAQFYGANCVTVTTKHARFVIDDNLLELGDKPITKDGDIALFTGAHGDPTRQTKLIIDRPGEYEVAGVSIFGVAARAHVDTDDVKNATLYKIVTEDLSLLVVGHIYPELSESQLETIGTVDVMFIPIGGNGYTLDPVGALKILKEVEPKIVIPTYYDDPRLTLPVPAQSLDQALKTMAMDPKEVVQKLRLKSVELQDNTQLIVLESS
jgi:L-ascorbate metabolism protein UlaG (beta-lactamase superfamily)